MGATTANATSQLIKTSSGQQRGEKERDCCESAAVGSNSNIVEDNDVETDRQQMLARRKVQRPAAGTLAPWGPSA